MCTQETCQDKYKNSETKPRNIFVSIIVKENLTDSTSFYFVIKL